jgi:plastocyanin
MRTVLPLLLLLLAPASAAQTPAATVEVQLSSFAFTPRTIRLRAGAPVSLRLTNTGRGGHNFSAPEFFAAAQPTGATLRDGAIEVPSRQTVEVRLVPRRGTYRLRCTHTLHTSFGMRGEIVVE